MTIPTVDDLPEPQVRTLAAIRDYWASEGIAPSIRDLMSATGYRSVSTIHNAVIALEAAGYVTHRPGCNRTIRVTA